jgi:hypothetical protein
MLAKDKIFFIERPSKANQLATNNTILQQIYDKT